MNEYEEKLAKFINDNRIDAELIIFQTSCHSVEEAAASANASPDEFVKNICTIDENGNLIVSIIPGKAKLDIKKVGTIVSSKVRFATAVEILERTGYPAGGTPSFAYNARFIVDPRVFEMEKVYSGGGSQNALTKIKSTLIPKITGALVEDIIKVTV